MVLKDCRTTVTTFLSFLFISIPFSYYLGRIVPFELEGLGERCKLSEWARAYSPSSWCGVSSCQCPDRWSVIMVD